MMGHNNRLCAVVIGNNTKFEIISAHTRTGFVRVYVYVCTCVFLSRCARANCQAGNVKKDSIIILFIM